MEKSQVLTRDEIKEKIQAADDVHREKVHVPEWGVDVWVASLRACDRGALDATIIRERGNVKEDAVELIARNVGDMRAWLVVLTAETEAGEKLFTMDDVPWLTRKSAVAVSRISNVAQDLSGMTAEAVGAMRKNSQTRSSDSGTA